MEAEVGRFECFVYLIFCFSLSGILFLFFFWGGGGGQYFFGGCGTYRFLLENQKVMFPFSIDTVTLCLNVS